MVLLLIGCLPLPMYEIDLVRPCADHPDRYIAEARLPSKIDFERVDRVLQGLPDLKFSGRLGVAKFTLDGREVIVYRSGRVDLREIRSVEDARGVMQRLEGLLQGCFL